MYASVPHWFIKVVSDIILDKRYTAKLSDFDMHGAIVPENKTLVTAAYFPPELASGEFFTSDVYSYGVMHVGTLQDYK